MNGLMDGSAMTHLFHASESVDGWVDRWKDGWVDGGMDEWVGGWIGRWVPGRGGT